MLVDSPGGRRCPRLSTPKPGALVVRFAARGAPFIGTLWVSTYASKSPELWGFPFFYWYQFAWVIAGAGITAFVYLITTPRRRRGGPPGAGETYPDSPAPRTERSRTR